MADDSSPIALARFPQTRQSAVLGAASDDAVARARSFDVLVRAYWKPVYTHVRIRWRRPADAAEDLTQGFFSRAFERRFFRDYDPQKAHFRTYLKTCLDRFVVDEQRTGQRIKRGGEAIRLSLDFTAAEEELQRFGMPGGQRPDESFDRAWMRHLLGTAVDRLREACETDGKPTRFALFRRLVLDDDLEPRPSYRAIAEELGITVTQVTNDLAWARRAFRQLVLGELRDITTTEEEFEDEARALLGVAP